MPIDNSGDHDRKSRVGGGANIKEGIESLCIEVIPLWLSIVNEKVEKKKRRERKSREEEREIYVAHSTCFSCLLRLLLHDLKKEMLQHSCKSLFIIIVSP